MTQGLQIAVLHYQPSDYERDPVVDQIIEALTTLGHSATPVAASDKIGELLDTIAATKCDLVFNVCETFAEDYRLEVNVAALMEMAGIRFTGSGTAGLLLAQDKILTKQLLDYHGVTTPRCASFDGETFETNGPVTFPLIVKPAKSDSSIGISQYSIVNDWEELTKRVRSIRKEFNDDSLAEEFIDGREVYVGILGNARKAEVLPIVELNWGDWDPNKPRISDRNVKFGPEYDGSPELFMAQLSPNLRARIERAALFAFKALKVRDYARVDIRISKTDEPHVLEVNPNPYLEAYSELSMAAEDRGYNYIQLIERIIESACTRYGIKKSEDVSAPKVSAKAVSGAA